jgi:hypothetical protein
MRRPFLALGGKSWQRSNFGSFLGVKRRIERVDVMPALDPERKSQRLCLLLAFTVAHHEPLPAVSRSRIK